MEMNFRQYQEMQKLNRIKRENDCLVCEIVITKELKHPPISIVQGNGGPIEMAQMAKVLTDVAEALVREFPEIKDIMPMIKEHGGMRTAYKQVEKWEEL